MPPNGSESLSQLDLFALAMLTSEASSMVQPTTSPDIPNVISLPVLADGQRHSEGLNGQTPGRFGPEAAHVSHSAAPANVGALTTRATFGPCGNGSSPSDALQ